MSWETTPGTLETYQLGTAPLIIAISLMPSARRDPEERLLSRLALLMLCLRLLTWAFLLPPWAGFDEPYHQGLVETYSDQSRWHPFLSVTLPPRLLEGMRRWPLFSGYANAFAARTYGEDRLPARSPVLDRNYETLQSPPYYFLAGALLEILPPLDPIDELLLFRVLNAVFGVAVGFLAFRAARLAGFGRHSWYPVLLLAFIPGYALALVRVSNDALCALLVSIAVVGALRSTLERRAPNWTSATAAGLAPWAKLYGWAVVPRLAWNELKNGRSWRTAGRLALLFVPGAALAVISWKKNGHPVSLLENLQHPAPVALTDVPWVKDFWTIIKTQIWLSGMSNIVFPTVFYVAISLAFGYLFFTAVRSFATDRELSARPLLLDLLVPLLFFWLALGYFSYRNFALYRGPGGTGGWYLWSMAVPEALILTYAATRTERANRVLSATLIGLLAVTVAGDILLFAEPSGRLIYTLPTHHIRGVAPGPLSSLAYRFFVSRPEYAAWSAVCLASASWALGVFCLIRAWTSGSINRNPSI